MSAFNKEYKYEDYMILHKMSENKAFIFFRLGFRQQQIMGYYDKNSGQTYVAETVGKKIWNGFENDLDDFVPFYPEFINEQGEILGLIQAEQVVEWFENNPEKVAALPEHLKKLQSMKPEDNPLVMIAKPK